MSKLKVSFPQKLNPVIVKNDIDSMMSSIVRAFYIDIENFTSNTDNNFRPIFSNTRGALEEFEKNIKLSDANDKIEE